MIRRLEAQEFPRLSEVAEGTIPDPKITIALVAERGTEIVSRMFLMAPAHIEGTWIREDARNGTLAKRMMDRMETEARSAGISRLFAYIEDPAIEDYMKRLGFERKPVTVWVKELQCL